MTRSISKKDFYMFGKLASFGAQDHFFCFFFSPFFFSPFGLCLKGKEHETKKSYTFLCLALSFPSVPKTQQVLYNFPPLSSGMDPPTIVIFRLRESSDNIAVEGDALPPASISSAYTGKLSFEYGLFHIS